MRKIKIAIFALALSFILFPRSVAFAAESYSGYISAEFSNGSSRKYELEISESSGNVTIYMPYWKWTNETDKSKYNMSTMLIAVSDEPFSEFRTGDFGATAVKSKNAVYDAYLYNSGTLTLAWSQPSSITYEISGVNYVDMSDIVDNSKSTDEIRNTIMDWIVDNGYLDLSKNHLEEGELSENFIPNFDTDHNFSLDIYDMDIPVPELSNLSYDGFYVNNGSDSLFLDVYATTSFYGVKHRESNVNLGLDLYYVIDKSSVIGSHRYNFTTYDLAFSGKRFSISDNFGINLSDDLIQDFKTWSVLYPSHKKLPDYSWLKHGSSIWADAYLMQLYGRTGDDYSDLKQSRQAAVTYYVRFYQMVDKELKYGKWISYTYQFGFSDTSNLTIGDVAANSDGSPYQTNTYTGYQKENGDFSYTFGKYDGDGNVTSLSIDGMDASALWSTLNGLVSGMGQVPTLLTTVFGFFPSWLLAMIAVGIGAIVVLRFLGR